MNLPFLNIINRLRTLEKHEFVKLMCVSAIFALVIMAYTILKEFKDIVFVGTVGIDYVPNAKLVSIVILIPFILIYSFLVNKLRRYQLLCLYAIVYGILGLLFAYLLGNPIYGLLNPVTSPNRVLGWVFYTFIEGASPFIVGVTWAFTNSVFSPKEAREGYGFLVAFSKIGGMLGAGLSWYFLTHFCSLSGIFKQQMLIILPSATLLLVPVAIMIMMKKVARKYLHGYEAAYEYEKEADKQQKQPGIFSGLKLFAQQPYVLGIFSMVLFYEVVDAVLSYLRLIYARGEAPGLEQFGGKLFAIAFSYHCVGFFIALFGTAALLHRLGERRCLMLIPIAIGALLFSFLAFNTFTVCMVVFVCMRAINYGFLYPVRESLYIPTVKAIKFQSKAWIDAFGKRFAKALGAQFNILSRTALHYGGFAMFQLMHWSFFAFIISCWTIAAYFLGKRYTDAISTNKVIGASDDDV